jgi:hypothetical protein
MTFTKFALYAMPAGQVLLFVLGQTVLADHFYLVLALMLANMFGHTLIDRSLR